SLGDDGFHNLITDYLVQCAPREASLGRAGDRLAAFTASHALGASRPWLADLAALECARSEVFFAADAPAFTFEEVQARVTFDPAGLPLELIPAYRLLQVGYDVDAVEEALETPATPGTAKRFDPKPMAVLVWRRGLTVLHRPLDELERDLLERAARGTT